VPTDNTLGKFSVDVVGKAHELLDQERVMPDPEFVNIWWVTSSDGEHTYRVQSDYSARNNTLSWITCTCPHGLNQGGGTTRCYHAAAVLIKIRRGREGWVGEAADA
jgi:hypothetical protein